jgi:hypothetical protein
MPTETVISRKRKNKRHMLRKGKAGESHGSLCKGRRKMVTRKKICWGESRNWEVIVVWENGGRRLGYK